MAKNGPIVIVEDDPDDEHLFADVLKELNITKELICFTKR